MNNDWFEQVIACPDCGAKLTAVGTSFECSACDFSDTTMRDLRPQRRQSVAVEMMRTQVFNPEEVLRRIPTKPPPITYRGPGAIRDSRELLSVMNQNLSIPGRVLDLGCGPRDQQVPIEHLGHCYVGIDYASEKADFLADAHALPFRKESFQCVFSYAVLEHLHNPFIAITEIERVLCPGGIFIGTVSQGEPFHQSYFHHTSWGLISLLAGANNLKVRHLWPCNDTLEALSRMGRYSRLIRACLHALDRANASLPFLTPRKMRWPAKDRELDAIYRSGSIAFLVIKDTQ